MYISTKIVDWWESLSPEQRRKLEEVLKDGEHLYVGQFISYTKGNFSVSISHKGVTISFYVCGQEIDYRIPSLRFNNIQEQVEFLLTNLDRIRLIHRIIEEGKDKIKKGLELMYEAKKFFS